MNFKVINSNMYQGLADTLVIGVHEGFDASVQLQNLREGISEMVKDLMEEGVFSGKDGEIQSFRLTGGEKPKCVILVGLGRKELTLERARRASAKMIRECRKLKSVIVCLYSLDLKLGENLCVKDAARAVAEGAVLADYSFEIYKSDKKGSTIKEILLVNDNKETSESLKSGLEEGRLLAEAANMARDMVNEPANTLTPAELGKRALEAGKESGFEVEVLDEDRICELGMRAFYEVAKGSQNPPRLIVMRYFGNEKNKDDIVALVGKGLTYDSGGYALKTLEGMVNMKSDMAGSAAVIGAMKAIAAMKLGVNVVGIVAACENMVSGGAYKNGDVIGSMSGKTIEIKSTDAEGRLTLADAVYYAAEKEGAAKIVDIATLTGAALVALGTTTTAVIANDDEFYGRLERAAERTGEKIWRLPGFEEYRELIKSDIADLKNSGGRFGGTITGGLFVGEFVQGKPWIHMDIAGTSGSDKDNDYICKGATGVGVRTLYELVKGMQ